jgi:hypothetical protein
MLLSFPFAFSADIQVVISPTSGESGTEIKVTINNWPDTNFLPPAIYMQDIAEEGSRWNLLPVDPDKEWEITGNTLTRSYTIYPLAIEGPNRIMVGGVGGGSLAETNFDGSKKEVTDSEGSDNEASHSEESSSEGAGLSGILLQGTVSAGAGIGITELIKRLRGKPAKKPIPTSHISTLKEKMKQLPPEPEQPNTGSVQGEEVIRLPTEDKYQKRDLKGRK